MEKTLTNAPKSVEFLDKVNEVAQFFTLFQAAGLLFCVADNFYMRKEVNRQIKERLSFKNILVIEVLLENVLDSPPIHDQLRLALKEDTKGIIINNFDYLLSKYPDTLMALNQSRELLLQLEIPLLFWISEENIPLLSRSAVDIYNVRSLPLIHFQEIIQFENEGRLLERFDETYRTKEEYEKIKLKIELLERQLKEAEANRYPTHKIIEQIVIPLFKAYREIQIADKANALFTKYGDSLNEDSTLHLEMRFNYLKDNRKYQGALKIAGIIEEKVITANDQEKLSWTYDRIASIYEGLGDFKQALIFQKRVLVIMEGVLDSNHPDLASAYNNIALIYNDLGDFKKALFYQEKSLAIKEEVLDSNYLDLATSYNNIALIYRGLGNFQEALNYNEKSLAIIEENLDGKNLFLASSYDNIAIIYRLLGDFDKALLYQKKALFIIEDILVENDFGLAVYYNNIALTYNSLGDFIESLNYQKKAMGIQTENLSHNHPDLAASYNNIALTYHCLRDFKKALYYNEKSLIIREDILPNNHPDLSTSYNNIAHNYQDLGDLKRALFYHEKSLIIKKKTLNRNHPSLATTYNNIAQTYFAQKKYDLSLQYQQKAFDIISHGKNKDLPAYQEIKNGLAIIKSMLPLQVMKKQGRNEPCACGSGKKYKKCCLNKK